MLPLIDMLCIIEGSHEHRDQLLVLARLRLPARSSLFGVPLEVAVLTKDDDEREQDLANLDDSAPFLDVFDTFNLSEEVTLGNAGQPTLADLNVSHERPSLELLFDGVFQPHIAQA